MNTSDTRRFGGISRLFGSNGLEKLSQSHVVIVGVGGSAVAGLRRMLRTKKSRGVG